MNASEIYKIYKIIKKGSGWIFQALMGLLLFIVAVIFFYRIISAPFDAPERPDKSVLPYCEIIKTVKTQK